jgi:PKD repeat protein
MRIIQNILFSRSLGLPPIILPVANFSASATSITQSNSVNFTDTSTVAPGGQAITSWTWSFEGGTPTSSNAQNPTITYNQTGSFDVSLTAANPSGSDTETKTNFIFVTASSVPAFSATGGTETTQGDYTVHTFTTSGQFVVTGSRDLEIFLVGRGGNGGNGTTSVTSGTGGNGGSALTTSSLFTTNNYGIRVGGAGSLYGTTETFSALQLSSASILLQANGGSNGGTGVSSGVSPGGNGAGGVSPGSNGGAGVSNTWGGPFTTYGGGGGGGGTAAGGAGGGVDGGGNGGYNVFPNNYAATSGTANRGGGGGGGYKFTPTGGGAGGSGIVIIRYLTNP